MMYVYVSPEVFIKHIYFGLSDLIDKIRNLFVLLLFIDKIFLNSSFSE